MNIWKDKTAAWPVANPIVTCASVSNAGYPSNFVADPFLYVQVISYFYVLILLFTYVFKEYDLLICGLSASFWDF